jgi:hypothetical protein
MKKFVFAVIIAAVAASPAMAAKKAKKAAAPAQPDVAQLNDNGFRFVRDSMPMYLPSVVKMVIYPVGNKEK